MSREPEGPVGVVIPAGGSGSRMAAPGAPSKQFRELGGAPVLVHSVRAVIAHADTVVVTVPTGQEAEVDLLLRTFGLDVTVVTGGRTRQASVYNGLSALGSEVAVVLVHDAVRPFLPGAVLTEIIGAVRTHGAAAVGRPVADTLRRGGAGPLFGDGISRDGLWAMQTPQGARAEWLRRAFALAGGEVFTDEVGLLQNAGYPVRIVEGDARTFKITRPADWVLAEALWPSWRDEQAGP